MPRTSTSRLILVINLALLVLFAVPLAAQDLPELEFEKYTLDNGLQVILHEDHSIPMVSVNIWYHVGSKNEEPGRTGFAHLFEHMMFQGSEHSGSEYFKPIEKVGGEVNGSTTQDRTNYWENVPSDQLELALWLESDRMAYLLPAMTEESFQNQQDVVKNEKRQRDNSPYSRSDELLGDLLYPDEHPYSWTVIGSLDDLSAASLEDVKEFFRLYYAPNNASLCIAGDFDPEVAKALVAKYFAPVPPGRPVERMEAWVPQLEGERRAVTEDAVELPRLYLAWNTPGWYQPGDAELDFISDVLSSGKTSRLYKRLVYDLQIAQDVAAYQDSMEMSSQFVIQATARPGHDLAELETVIDEELTKLLADGVTSEELDLALTANESAKIRGLQRVGGFGGRADRLNRYNVFTGDPGYLAEDFARYRRITTDDLRSTARRYLDIGRRAVLHIVPQGNLEAAADEPDRSVKPVSTGQPVFDPPAIQRATLANGLELFLVEKHDLPLVDINLCLLSGWAADPAGRPGTAALTAELLDEGTTSRSALEISEQARRLGARLGTGSFFDGSFVNLNILKRNLDQGLALVGDLVLNPNFPQAELERKRKNYLGRIRQESAQPVITAIKILQRRLYGPAHPYAQSFTGTGTADSLAALTRDDMVRFHASHYLPNNAAAVVVGDITLAEAKAKLEQTFASWRQGPVTRLSVPAPVEDRGARVVLVDRPGAPQSFILAGHLGMTRNDPAYQAFSVMNTVFGAQFISRLNMNLREDKGYTYGARANLAGFREGGIFFATAPVHTEYTKESIIELLREMTDIRGDRPVTGEELGDAKNINIKGFPQRFQTYGAISGQLQELILNDLPMDEWETFMDRVGGLESSAVAQVVKAELRPDDLIFVIIGDREKIEPGIRELDLGEIAISDATEL